MAALYMYMWEFIVSPDHAGAFEQTYGPSGEWIHLFRRAPGYVRSELHRDRSQPRRFITIDYWESAEAWEAFRSRFGREFEALDRMCTGWTTSEAEIGRFEPVP